MKSVLANPATLAKLKLAESFLLISSTAGLNAASRTTNVTETSGTFEGGTYGLFLRAPANISGLAPREISVDSNLNYATNPTGLSFSSALKINDWLTLGFATNNPFGAEINLAGDFPTTAKSATNLNGQTLGQMQIGTDSKLRYTFSSGGTVATYESTQPLWSGFITQEAVIPLTSISALRNNFDFQSPYTATLAGGTANFHVGMNMIPVNATANIDNTVQEIVPAGTSDIFLYIPNFDPDSESDLVGWINDPDRYGTAGGYLRKQLKLPAGELVGESKYQGFYSAGTARLDIGFMYDVNDWVSLGLDLENIGGSSLNFKGSGLASYISYRNYDTAEAGSLQDLLLPGGRQTVDLLPDRWITTFEAGSTKLFLEPEKNYALPRRLRLGAVIRRPFLIAIDYESNQNPITIPGSLEASNLVISNLSFIRLGFETRVFVLPWWLRFGTSLMLKPTLTGGDPATVENVNKFFKYGVLPARFDLGSTLNFWSYEVSSAFGFSAMPAVNLLQFDTQNVDLSKTVYYALGIKKDAWEINYLSAVDPFSTAAAYSNKPDPADGSSKRFEFNDVKYVQTLGVTYRF
jgi:hypothetical protein